MKDFLLIRKSRLAACFLTLAALSFSAVNIFSQSPERVDVSLRDDPVEGWELDRALSLLGIDVNRFAYEYPEKHRLKFRMEKYADGESVYPSQPGSSAFLEGGQVGFVIFVERKSDKLFRFSAGTRNAGGLNMGYADVDVKKNRRIRTGGLALEPDVETPIYWMAADDDHNKLNQFFQTHPFRDADKSLVEDLVIVYVTLDTTPNDD